MIALPPLRRAVAEHGAVVRVVVAGVRGSAPREAGAAMLVWAGGQEGTIGGGALEFQAADRARRLLARGGGSEILRQPLGPGLGQCCGGAVTLVFETWDAARLAEAERAPVYLRRAEGEGAAPEQPVPMRLQDGWLAEPVDAERVAVLIHGAGHVGRALARVLAPLPDLAVTLCDDRPAQLTDLPPGVDALPDPRAAIAGAPPEARHYIMTHDHGLDLALCDLVLHRGFAGCGLIGSATKWARFRKRLRALGHDDRAIARIDCPIGDPSLGRDPQAIAISVAARLLREIRAGNARARSEGAA